MDLILKPKPKGKIQRSSFRKKLYVYIVCCILASFIWLLIKLSKEYSEQLQIRVIYTNVPYGFVVVNDPDTILSIQLKTKGIRLLVNQLFYDPQPFRVDMAKMVKKRINSTIDYYLPSSMFVDLIEKHVSFPNSVIKILPDTLYFRMEKVFNKKVPVKTLINLDFAQQYALADSISSKPDSVIVSGKKTIIDTIKFVETESKTFSGLSITQNLIMSFNKKYSLVKLSIVPSTEKVTIPVSKFTEASIDLPVIITNNPNKYVVKTFPEKVKITYLVPLAKYKEVQASMFTLTADIGKSLHANLKKIKPELIKFPEFVHIRKIEPEKIEFILLK